MEIKVILQTMQNERVELTAPIDEFDVNFNMEADIISLKIGDIPRDFADWYVTVDRVNELYDAICEEDEAVIQTMLDYGYSIRKIENIIKSGGCTVFDADNMAGVAEQICEECGWLSDTPEFLHGYINYQKLGRDMEVSGNFLFNYDYGFIVEIYN